MLVADSYQMQQAVADAVRFVNAHAGQASVRLSFMSPDFGDVDFVANSASLAGDRFSFSTGLETVDGKIAELTGIRAELIQH